ncbi:MAG TPA: hypothetical protein VFY99_10630 [Solirubrobacterales bacterium]
MTDRQADTAVVLRAASSADAPALDRLAQLDTRSLPPGPHLVAERAGSIEAAISLRTGELVANPFARTAELSELLALHAASARVPDRVAPRGSQRPRPLGATA